MRFLFYSLLTMGVLLVVTSSVEAHPGRTDSSGGHTCRTNCPSWGLNTGEYHDHNGGSDSVPLQESRPAYIAPISEPTNTPVPTATPTPTPTLIPTPTNTPTLNPSPTPLHVVEGISDTQQIEGTTGSNATGYVLLSALGGLGYWVYRRRKKKNYPKIP